MTVHFISNAIVIKRALKPGQSEQTNQLTDILWAIILINFIVIIDISTCWMIYGGKISFYEDFVAIVTIKTKRRSPSKVGQFNNVPLHHSLPPSLPFTSTIPSPFPTPHFSLPRFFIALLHHLIA